MHKFNEIRTQWLATQGQSAIAKKYGLASNQNSCIEESYNEDIRTGIEDRYEDDEYYKNIIRKCNEELIGRDKDTSRKFWKRQLSRTFFTGDAPPCPVLTSLTMQREDIRFCFECHASNSFEDWIEGHARAMKIMPTMMTGEHQSNCVHNAHNIVKKNIKAHEDYAQRIDVYKLLQYKASKPSKSWLSTEGIDAFMLNESNTDTLIIQK